MRIDMWHQKKGNSILKPAPAINYNQYNQHNSAGYDNTNCDHSIGSINSKQSLGFSSEYQESMICNSEKLNNSPYFIPAQMPIGKRGTTQMQ